MRRAERQHGREVVEALDGKAARVWWVRVAVGGGVAITAMAQEVGDGGQGPAVVGEGRVLVVERDGGGSGFGAFEGDGGREAAGIRR